MKQYPKNNIKTKQTKKQIKIQNQINKTNKYTFKTANLDFQK